MLEIVHLDARHVADLYKFFIKYKDGILLIPKRDIFLSSTNGIAIACLEDKQLKQVLVGEIKDGTAFTRGIIGEIGEFTVDLLDALCAICSSNEPMITKHHMVILSNHIDSFKALWPKTRLGMMSSNESWMNTVFRATINYPLAG